MALEKVSMKGGCGGRLGHSNMSHWTTTAVVKLAARKRLRRHGTAEALSQLEDSEVTRGSAVVLARKRRYPSQNG